MSNQQQSDDERAIIGALRQSALSIEPTRTELPSTGYKGAGERLHQSLQSQSSWVTSPGVLTAVIWSALIISVGFVVFAAREIGIINNVIVTPWRAYPPLIAVALAAAVLIHAFIAPRLVDSSESTLTFLADAHCRDQPRIWAVGGPSRTPKAQLEQLDGPWQLREEEMSLQEWPADEESIHVAEFVVNETNQDDNLLVDKELTLADGHTSQLLMNEPIKMAQANNVNLQLQVVVTARSDQAQINSRQGDIRNERDYGIVGAIKAGLGNMIIELIVDHDTQEKQTAASDQPHQLDPAELRGRAARRYQTLEQVNGDRTFGLNIRALAYAPSDDSAIGQVFQSIKDSIGARTAGEISVTTRWHKAPATNSLGPIARWRRRKALERFANGAYRDRSDTWRPTQTPAIIADPDTIWGYLLLSAATGSRPADRHGATPRDSTPTERPVGGQLDGYRSSESVGADVTGDSTDDAPASSETLDDETDKHGSARTRVGAWLKHSPGRVRRWLAAWIRRIV